MSRWRPLAAAVALLAGVLGVGAVVTANPDVPSTSTVQGAARVAEPTRLSIPSIQVDADLIGLGIEPDGAPTVPDPNTQYAVPSWFNLGVRPGEPGPALILGHVDGGGHKGIFGDLHKLKVGAEVTVARADGTRVTFRITKVEQVAKAEFPVDAVYGPTEAPEIRLVTCGGRFDRTTRQYDDNVVAYGELVG